MSQEKVVFVRCTFQRGGFPNELVFILRGEGGAELAGVAQMQYCRDRQRRPLKEVPPSSQGIEGLVMGVLIGRHQDGTARVHLPDGDIYEIGDDLFEDASQKDREHVSVEP